MGPLRQLVPAFLLGIGCGDAAPVAAPVTGRAAALVEEAAPPGPSCEPRRSEVLYLGPCRIGAGGIYTEPDSGLRCQVMGAVDTTFEGQPACRETRSCVPVGCTLPPASPSFSQAPMQGTAAPESFDPNMIGD